jgi:N-acetylglucosaminyl-diphospho-decaprenol L-rhamnosyltransferase
MWASQKGEHPDGPEPTARRSAKVVANILVVIVNYRTPALVESCIDALAAERASGVQLTAIVADGCSGDDSIERITRYLERSGHDRWVKLLPLEFNGGFGWANNQAILHHLTTKIGLPDFIYLLNPDTEVSVGAVSALANAMRDNPAAAAIGSQLIEPGGHVTASAFRFPTLRREFAKGAHVFALQKWLGLKPFVVSTTEGCRVDWVTGASVMLRTKALEQSGLFDDGFFLYFEEVELMHRLTRAGWQVRCEPQSRVMHVGGAATGVDKGSEQKPLPDYWYRSRQRYFILTRGRFLAALANLAWFVGYMLIGLPRMAVSRKTRRQNVPGEPGGISKAAFGRGSFRKRPSTPRLQPQPYRRPAWVDFK